MISEYKEWDALAKLNLEVKRLILEYSRNILPSLWQDILLYEVKKILDHAANNTEYWREIICSTGADSQDISDLAKFSRLPLLTRADLKEQSNDTFLAENVPETRRIRAYTSGSTGEPIAFYQDTKELVRRRLDVVYGLRLHGVRLRKLALISGLDTHSYLDPLGYKFSNLRDKDYRLSVFYPQLEELKPEIFFCTPSYLEMFYMCLLEDGRHFRFKMIYCAGESLSRKKKEIFACFFDSKIATWYGTRETGPIAVECPSQNYHLLPWSNYAEIVNRQGYALNHAEEGDVVVTSFSNYVMPFIRYKTGDRGMIVPQACDCGSRTPVLKLAGRAPIIIKTPGGNSFAMSEVGTTVASRFNDTILKFQFIEEGDGEYIFRFVPATAYKPELDATLLKMLLEIAGQHAKVRLEKVKILIPNEFGKTPLFLRRKKQPIDAFGKLF